MCNKRAEGTVLVGRKDGAYWFVNSVFRYRAGFYGCTGMTVYPVSEEEAKDALSLDQLEDRFDGIWKEMTYSQINADCDECAMGPREEGCEHCGYQSLRDFCGDIARSDGYDAVYDHPGNDCEEALVGLPELLGKVETVNCISCGRIFGRDTDIDGFDEVYNREAFEACIAYENGVIDYDCAVDAIFND